MNGKADRCPECHSWLKPAAAGAGTPSTGWGGGSDGGPSAVPVSERSTIRVAQPKPTRKVKKKQRLEDIPIDPELANECLEWAFEEPDRRANLAKIFAVGLTGIILIVGLKMVQPFIPTSLPSFDYTKDKRVVTDAETEAELAIETDLNADPQKWISGAQTSMSEGKFRLAAAQYRKAVGLMEEADSDPTALTEAKLGWANAALLNEDFQRVHAIWSDLEDTNPELEDKAKDALLKADRELRKVARAKVEESKSVLQTGNVDSAIALADEALDLCLTHHAEGRLLASAHAAVGAAYLAGGNTKVAVSHYAEANRVFPQPDYESKLSLARTSGPPKADAPESRRTVVGASSVPEAQVPKGKRVSARRRPTATGKDKPNYVEPAKAHLSKEVPAYQAPLQDKRVRESTRNAPPGYYSN